MKRSLYKKLLFPIVTIISLFLFNTFGWCNIVENQTADSSKKKNPDFSSIWTATGFQDSITSVLFSPNGKTIVTGTNSYDNTIRFHHTASGKTFKTIPTPNSWNLTFTSDGNTLIGGGQSTIKFWDVATGNELKTINGISSSLRSLAISPDGEFIVTGGLDTKIKFWSVTTGTLIVTSQKMCGRKDAPMLNLRML